jgi:hypothetical protein
MCRLALKNSIRVLDLGNNILREKQGIKKMYKDEKIGIRSSTDPWSKFKRKKLQKRMKELREKSNKPN